MAKLVATVPIIYNVDFIIDKEGKPLINLEDFCQVLNWVLTDAFDFFDDLKEKMNLFWPEVGNYVEHDGKWYITIAQAYILISQSDDVNRSGAAVYLLEQTLPKALNKNRLD